MKIAVLGAGAWGTALATSAARQSAHHVVLWMRDAAQHADMAQRRENLRYLPCISLPESLDLASGHEFFSQSLAHQDLVVIATPMAALADTLAAVNAALQAAPGGNTQVPVAWLCKGFEPQGGSGPGRMGHEVQAAVAPALQAGVLSGPSFAQEVALARPTALVAASAHAAVREALVQAFHCTSLRVYANDDVAGVEVGGAVKNVLAIATGLCDGLALGANARAALVTRGLTEMARLGLALGARADTFMGLSGLGDLVLTATGDLSRNRRVGLALAQGQSLAQAVQQLGHVAEGVYCARTVQQRAHSLGVPMPITECVVQLLDGALQPAQAVARLMERGPQPEARA